LVDDVMKCSGKLDCIFSLLGTDKMGGMVQIGGRKLGRMTTRGFYKVGTMTGTNVGDGTSADTSSR
jgi:hypothetical protein